MESLGLRISAVLPTRLQCAWSQAVPEDSVLPSSQVDRPHSPSQPGYRRGCPPRPEHICPAATRTSGQGSQAQPMSGSRSCIVPAFLWSAKAAARHHTGQELFAPRPFCARSSKVPAATNLARSLSVICWIDAPLRHNRNARISRGHRIRYGSALLRLLGSPLRLPQLQAVSGRPGTGWEFATSLMPSLDWRTPRPHARRA